MILGACGSHQCRDGTETPHFPPPVGLDPCSARNPIRLLQAVYVTDGHDNGEVFKVQMAAAAPVCIRLSAVSPPACEDEHGRGSEHDREDDDHDGHHGPGGGDDRRKDGGRPGGDCLAPHSLEVALDRGVGNLASLPFARGVELTAGPHELRVRAEGARGARIAVSLDVPGPVVDELSPIAGPAGTTVTLHGEGFFAPLQVLSNGTQLAALSVFSQGEMAVTTVPGMLARPLTVTSPFGTTETSQVFTPLVPFTEDKALDGAQNELVRGLQAVSTTPLYVTTWARASVVSRLDVSVPSGAPPGSTLEAHARAFLRKYAALWRLENATLKLTDIIENGDCSSVTLQLMDDILPVYSASLRVTMTQQGLIRSVVGRMTGDAIMTANERETIQALLRHPQAPAAATKVLVTFVNASTEAAAALPAPEAVIFDPFFSGDAPHQVAPGFLWQLVPSVDVPVTDTALSFIVNARSHSVVVSGPPWTPSPAVPFTCAGADPTEWVTVHGAG